MAKNKRWFEKLTPALAWQQYVDTPVEMFVSNFYLDGVVEISQMCQIYASELPIIFKGQLFEQWQIERIAELLDTYMTDYIEKRGGIDKLELYSEGELEEIFIKEVNEATRRIVAEISKDKRKF